ncbi:response regulator transcription factor [Kineosporia sp. A_224]|uniref:response regulator transcription factor n=1 Tax=Kineosporia sp. A_224 TaxID=1962180 RepID=UPI0018E9CFE6|nr:response regulator transcription factor [Kineosporia sp. A_224]
MADDHPMVRYGIVAVLTDVSDIDVMAEAADGAQLLAAIEEHLPDVVVTDLDMPGTPGVRAIAEIRARWPQIGVLVLTMHSDDEAVFTALRAGAHGYLLKGADRAELVRGIHSVAAGEAVYGATVAARIVAFFTGNHRQYTAQAFPDLTDRERDVLTLLAQGRRNSEIAVALGLSDKTVRNLVSAVLVKLHVPDRTAAALKARDAGIS